MVLFEDLQNKATYNLLMKKEKGKFTTILHIYMYT